MPNDPQYTAVTMTKAAKADLEWLQVVLSLRAGKRLTYGETISRVCALLAPRPAPVEDPCAGGCTDPPRHAEGGHDV